MKKAHLFIRADGAFIVEVWLGRARVWGAVCISVAEPEAEAELG